MEGTLKEILSKFIKEINEIKYFTGDERDKENFNATLILAGACPLYKEDEEEEIYSEGARTCYNCRFRRWLKSGFSCFHGFPVS